MLREMLSQDHESFVQSLITFGVDRSYVNRMWERNSVISAAVADTGGRSMKGLQDELDAYRDGFKQLVAAKSDAVQEEVRKLLND